MTNESIEFIPTTFVAFEIVRASGKCNMFDGNCVVKEMVNNGYINEALQLVKNRPSAGNKIRVDTKKYSELLKQANELYNTMGKMTDT